jgi:hypothetical protein
MKVLVNHPLFLSALEESEPHKHNFLLFSLSSPKYGTENPLIINCCFVLIGSHKRPRNKIIVVSCIQKGDVCGNCLALACIIPMSFQFTFSLVSGVQEGSSCTFQVMQLQAS